MSLDDLISCSPDVLCVDGSAAVDVSGISYDSRKVRPGFLFVAIKGFRDDGNRYVDEAIQRGAVAIATKDRGVFSGLKDASRASGPVAVLVGDERRFLAHVSSAFYGNPSHKLRLVGVTGTNGKTTTTYLLEAIFREAGFSTGLLGTISGRINDRPIVLERTTPESLDLQGILSVMVENGVEYCVSEVSSHAIELKRVSGCRFEAAVFTNLTQDHLDFHGSMESYFAVKSSLFLDSSLHKVNLAVINLDDPYGVRLYGDVPYRKVSYSFGPVAEFGATAEAPVQRKGKEGSLMANAPSSPRADFAGRLIECSKSGIRLKVSWEANELEVHSPLLGVFNAYNVLCSFATAVSLGVDPLKVCSAIARVDHIPGRFQVVPNDKGILVVVDYAHTPDGLKNILLSVRMLGPRRVIAVFGCGGERDRAKRPVMGRLALELSDYVIVTSDNPRGEDPLKIIDEICAGMTGDAGPQRFSTEPDRARAIFEAIRIACPGDAVVIAGKGHEKHQQIGDRFIPFDDVEVAREALEARQ